MAVNPEVYCGSDPAAERQLQLVEKQVALATDTQGQPGRTVFVTGPHASGKSHAVRHSFAQEYAIFDLGPIIRAAHSTAVPRVSFGEWITNNEKQQGQHFTDELLAKTIAAELAERPAPEGTILIGNRSMRGITYLRERLGVVNSLLIYLSAPKNVLYERYKQREGQELTPEAFEAILQAEQAMGLGEVYEQADHIFENTCPVEDTATHLRRVIGSWSLGETASNPGVTE